MGIRKKLYLAFLLFFSFGLQGQPFVPVVTKMGKHFHELELTETISLATLSSQTGINSNVIRKEDSRLLKLFFIHFRYKKTELSKNGFYNVRAKYELLNFMNF